MKDYIAIGKKISLAKKGKKFSVAHKQALSEAQKKIDSPTRFQNGHKSSNSGRTHFKRGAEHPQWKGGYSLDHHRIAEYRRWQRAVKKRDKQCVECGSSEKLHAHHMDLDSTNNNLENGKTLCRQCHVQLHKTILSQAVRTRTEGAETTGEV